jgi:erythromycin esterase-like protein
MVDACAGTAASAINALATHAVVRLACAASDPACTMHRFGLRTLASTPIFAAAALFATGPVLADAGQPPGIVDRAIQAACTKRVVALGELPSHGEARAFELKAAIAQGLVARCGFNAVLFEAPQYEFEFIQRPDPAALVAERALDDAITPFWMVDALDGWRAWLSKQAAEKSLHVGGLDDQPGATSILTRSTLPDLIADALPVSDRAWCRATAARHLRWRYDPEHPFDAAEKARLHGCARSASDALAAGGQSADAALAHSSPTRAVWQAYPDRCHATPRCTLHSNGIGAGCLTGAAS